MNRAHRRKLHYGCELDGRMLWRCRRGMKELDVLLERYRPHASRGRLARRNGACSQLLLELPDPELAAYLLGHAAPADPQLARLARRSAVAYSRRKRAVEPGGAQMLSASQPVQASATLYVRRMQILNFLKACESIAFAGAAARRSRGAP